jgi:hypothetical protein
MKPFVILLTSLLLVRAFEVLKDGEFVDTKANFKPRNRVRGACVHSRHQETPPKLVWLRERSLHSGVVKVNSNEFRDFIAEVPRLEYQVVILFTNTDKTVPCGTCR